MADEAAERHQQAVEQLRSAINQRPRVDRVQAALAHLRRENHFAERFREAFRGEWR